MGYRQKYLQKLGLVSTLLFVGVLAGLTAPLPSDAVPTVTLKVDGGSAVSILSTTNTSSTCTTTEVTLGFTACYAINTNLTVNGAGLATNRSYNVRNAPGATARLRVADKLGQDKFSLIGVQFVPTPLSGQTVANWGSAAANTNETHKLTITMSNPFNAPINVNNKGTYVWAIRAGGEFRAGPTTTNACISTTGAPANCNNVGNAVTYPGTGTFNPDIGNRNILSPAGSAANTQPLSLTVAGPTSAIVSFSGLTNATLGQVNPTYPTFVCDSNGGTLATNDKCTPSITQTMTVTLKGPDTFVLVNGQDAAGANCTATLTATQQKQITFLTNLVAFLTWWESNHHSPSLEKFIAFIAQFLATLNSNPTGTGYEHVEGGCPGAMLVNLDFAIAAALDQIAFAASGASVVAPAPPEMGTITIVKNTTVETSATFTFDIDGPSPSDPSISMGGANSNSTVVTVDAGTYSITEIPLSGWTFDSASCVGTGDGVSNGVVGVAVPAGGNVNCTFNNNPVSTSTGTITIVKNTSLETSATFTFDIDGPSPSDPSISMGGANSNSTVVTVTAGTYSVEEKNNPPGWFFSSAYCGDTSPGFNNPVTGVVVPAGGNVTCHFNNSFD